MKKAEKRLRDAIASQASHVEVVAGDIVSVIKPETNRFAAALVKGAQAVAEDAKLIVVADNLEEAMETATGADSVSGDGGSEDANL